MMLIPAEPQRASARPDGITRSSWLGLRPRRPAAHDLVAADAPPQPSRHRTAQKAPSPYSRARQAVAVAPVRLGFACHARESVVIQARVGETGTPGRTNPWRIPHPPAA